MTQRTSLYNRHLDLNAKIIPFSGFDMPVNYRNGILHEYNIVRSKCGMFDVSHMGQLSICGDKSYDFLQNVTINDVSKLKVYDAQYSAMCNTDGGIIDDLILYKKPNGYYMVVNAGNVDKNLKWLSNNIADNVQIENQSSETSLIAIQGPDSRKILSEITDSDLYIKFYSYTDANILNESVMLSRTGYTGELGFELYGSHESIIKIWDRLIDMGVEPCGLASRDILRMEMKYCLYGNDINENTNPIEAGLSWITAINKDTFIGKESIIKSTNNFRLVAFQMLDRGIPRHDYEIQFKGKKIGSVTSGTQSFILKSGIGLGYVDSQYSKIGSEIDIIIRDKKVKAEIIRPPFIKNTSLLD